MRFTVRAQGVRSLDRFLGERWENYERRVKEDVRSTQSDVVAYARSHHRFVSRTGEAERSVEAFPLQYRGGWVGEVGTRRKITMFLHEGTRAHRIAPRRRKILRWSGNAGFVFARRVHHPGWRKDPFIRQALEHEERGIVSRFSASLRRIWGS